MDGGLIRRMSKPSKTTFFDGDRSRNTGVFLRSKQTPTGFLVVIARGKRLIPSRTQKLSPYAPMVLQFRCGRVGHCQEFTAKPLC